MKISRADALAIRMTSLLLRERPAGYPDAKPGDVAGVVTWFGAMQAQDMASGQWSLGVRLPHLTLADVNAALERREAVRTWPMRGTVHLVPGRDARWMVELMGPRVLAGAGRRHGQVGITPDIAARALDVLGAALAGAGGRLTRGECVAALSAAGLPTAGQASYHLLWYASQRGVTCIGPHIGKEQSFVLLDQWVPDPHRPGREEALATMALRFFRGHGPTTRPEFARWTGLTVADTRVGIAGAGDALATVDVDGTDMLVERALLDAHQSAPPAKAAANHLMTLPGFDEYLLGYKDRSFMIDDEHLPAIAPGANGIFRATVVRGGRVIATWMRTIGRTRVDISVLPLVPLAARDQKAIEAAFGPYEHFIGVPALITFG